VLSTYAPAPALGAVEGHEIVTRSGKAVCAVARDCLENTSDSRNVCGDPEHSVWETKWRQQ
jgi:hypothetical protein